MVLVDADRVEAAFGGEFQFVHEVVVHVMRAQRVEQRGMDVDPDRRMLLPKIVGQFGIGHQMEPHQLHGCSFGTAFRKIDRRSLTAQRGRVNRQRARISPRGIGKGTPRVFGLAASRHARLTVPETYCNNFQSLAAWTPPCARLCSPRPGGCRSERVCKRPSSSCGRSRAGMHGPAFGARPNTQEHLVRSGLS